MTDVVNDSNTDGIRAGRRADRFVQTPEWIVVAGLSPQAQALYTALLAHVNHARGDGLAWPGMDVLAHLLGYKRRQTIRKYITELAALGALDVERVQKSTLRHNIYRIHETPPAEYVGLRTMAEFYTQRRAETPVQTPRGAVAHIGRGADAHVGTDAVAPMNQTNQTTRSQPDELTSGDACAANPQQTSSLGDMKIFVSDKFWAMSDGHAQAALIRGAIKTLNKNGVQLRQDGRKILSDKLTALRDESGLSRPQLLDTLRYWVTEESAWSEFAYPPENRAA